MSLYTNFQYKTESSSLFLCPNKVYKRINFKNTQIPRNSFWNTNRHIKNENEFFKIFSTLEKDTKISEDDVRNYEGKKAIVVGAGPSGSSAAAYLAKNGFEVKVYEKFDNPENSEFKQKKSIVIILRGEVVGVFEDLEMDLPEINGGFKNGLHRFFGSLRLDPGVESPYFLIDMEERKNLVMGQRFDITRAIIDRVINKYGNKVEFNFNCECESIDFDKQIARFKNGNDIIEEEYDLLIGSDGLNSKVRSELQKYDKKFTAQKKTSNKVYCSIMNLDLPEEEDELSKRILPGFFIVAKLNVAEVEGKKIDSNFGMFKREDGKVNVNVSFFEDDLKFIKGNEKEWFEQASKDIISKSMAEDFIKKMSKAEFNSLGSMLRISSFIGPKTIIIGDAAHATMPRMGLGCNLAICDAKYIGVALQKEKDIDKALITYNELRYDKVQNAQDLEQTIDASLSTTFKEKLLLLYSSIHFLLHGTGNKFFPKYIPKPVQFQVTMNMVSTDYAIKFLKLEGTIVLFLIITSFLIIIKGLGLTSNIF